MLLERRGIRDTLSSLLSNPQRVFLKFILRLRSNDHPRKKKEIELLQEMFIPDNLFIRQRELPFTFVVRIRLDRWLETLWPLSHRYVEPRGKKRELKTKKRRKCFNIEEKRKSVPR